MTEEAKIFIGLIEENKKLRDKIDKLKGVQRQPIYANFPQERLEQAAILFKQGDYDGSLKENQKVLSMPGKSIPRDRALFNLGLIYAHGGNPKKDYEKSLFYFNKVIVDYPQSPLSEEAKLWIKVIQENQQLKEAIKKIKEVDIAVEEKKREKEGKK